MKTVGNKLLVECEKAKENRSAGGLFLPGELPSLTRTGKVVAIGPDVKTVQVGDSVMFETPMGLEIQAQENSVLVSLREDSVLAVL